jgi:NTP pyrophosphatase (non-canonical NTP hydrolase)
VGLLDDIMDEKPILARKCTVLLLLESMSPEDRADLETALEDVMIQSSIIARVLDRNGHKIKAPAIGRHRRGACACE